MNFLEHTSGDETHQKRTCGRKYLRQWLWHSVAKLCTKNY